MTINFDNVGLANSFLTEEHRQWQAQLRRFFENEVRPYAEEWDEQCDIPDELWTKSAAMGILGLGYPEEFGGTLEGIDIWHKNILHEELAHIGVGGVGATLMVHNIGLPPVINFAQQFLKQEIAPAVIAGTKRISLAITEPSGGSDVAQLKTTAKCDGDFYVVNGSKDLVNSGRH